jgi:hypothetical protein
LLTSYLPFDLLDRSTRGNVKKNVLPSPGRLTTPILPPWASTMRRAM